MSENQIIIKNHAKPLYLTHRLIFETALDLAPASIFEFGFWSADHLCSLKLLQAQASIAGADIAARMIEYAKQRNGDQIHDPEKPIALHLRDLAVPGSCIDFLCSAEFVFTQQVLLHIHEGDCHRIFMNNMWDVSRRYVLLVENFRRHFFIKDIKTLFPGYTTYLVSNEYAVGLLLDKMNASRFPIIESDHELRQIQTIKWNSAESAGLPVV